MLKERKISLFVVALGELRSVSSFDWHVDLKRKAKKAKFHAHMQNYRVYVKK